MVKTSLWETENKETVLHITNTFFLYTGSGVVSAVLSGAYDSSVSSLFCVVWQMHLFSIQVCISKKKSALPAETSALHLGFETVLFIVGLSLYISLSVFNPSQSSPGHPIMGRGIWDNLSEPLLDFLPWVFTSHTVFQGLSNRFLPGHIWRLNPLLQRMETEHNNCSPLLAFGTYCLLHPRGRDCLCVCCRLQHALFTGRFGFENNTSLEGVSIHLLFWKANILLKCVSTCQCKLKH